MGAVHIITIGASSVVIIRGDQRTMPSVPYTATHTLVALEAQTSTASYGNTRTQDDIDRLLREMERERRQLVAVRRWGVALRRERWVTLVGATEHRHRNQRAARQPLAVHRLGRLTDAQRGAITANRTQANGLAANATR